MENNLPQSPTPPVGPPPAPTPTSSLGAQNIPTPPLPPIPPTPGPSSKWLMISVVFIAVVVISSLLVVAFQLTKAERIEKANNIAVQPNKEGSVLSGTVGLNGTPPSGSSTTIQVRKVGTQTFATMVKGLAAMDGVEWSWNGAQKGELYETRAQIIFPNGEVGGTSSPYVMAAPATDEALHVNLDPKAFPTPTAAPTAVPTPSPILSSISGTFNLNGNIPTNATISVSARQVGAANFTTIATNLPAADNSTWSWTSAIQNAQYEIQATLNDGNNDQSQVISVTAPASNEVLTINSTVTTATVTTNPTATTGVSGTINLNGSIPSGAYITLGARITGSGNFNQVASNISATNGVTWTWSNALSGTTYDFQAYLWVNNQPASQSQILTVAAPANGEVLTMNAQSFQPPAPGSNTISVSCGSNSSGPFATVNINTGNNLTGAQQYWITVGSTGGGSDIANTTFSPSNPTQNQSYSTGPNISRGQTYYAQYAYATCTNCSNFSSFSQTVPFTCN